MSCNMRCIWRCPSDIPQDHGTSVPFIVNKKVISFQWFLTVLILKTIELFSFVALHIRLACRTSSRRVKGLGIPDAAQMSPEATSGAHTEGDKQEAAFMLSSLFEGGQFLQRIHSPVVISGSDQAATDQDWWRTSFTSMAESDKPFGGLSWRLAPLWLEPPPIYGSLWFNHRAGEVA